MTRPSRAFWVTEPGAGEVRDEPLPPDPTTGQVLVRTAWSAISRGTERLVFEGRVPLDQFAGMRAPFQVGDFPGPVKYGYLNVGVVEVGPADLVGRRCSAYTRTRRPSSSRSTRSPPSRTAYLSAAPPWPEPSRRPSTRCGTPAVDRRPRLGRRRRARRVRPRPAARRDARRHGHPGRRRGVPVRGGGGTRRRVRDPRHVSARAGPGLPHQRLARGAAGIARPARHRRHRRRAAGTATARCRSLWAGPSTPVG